jgi:hypothetical protein
MKTQGASMNSLTFLTLSLLSSAQQPDVVTERFSAANVIEFIQSGDTREFVGSGFLLNEQGKTYAVTAKHVLLAVMDQGIDAIELDGHIKQWRLQPFNESTGSVMLGDLLNAEASEKLGIEVLQNDWLLFEVTDNQSALQPVSLAKRTLAAGDPIHVYGCYYSNQDTCQQEHIRGEFITEKGANLLIRLDNHQPGQLRGLSGAPVLNDRHEVVGIVSNVIPDASGELLFAPFTIRSVADFLHSSPAAG